MGLAPAPFSPASRSSSSPSWHSLLSMGGFTMALLRQCYPRTNCLGIFECNLGAPERVAAGLFLIPSRAPPPHPLQLFTRTHTQTRWRALLVGVGVCQRSSRRCCCCCCSGQLPLADDAGDNNKRIAQEARARAGLAAHLARIVPLCSSSSVITSLYFSLAPSYYFPSPIIQPREPPRARAAPARRPFVYSLTLLTANYFLSLSLSLRDHLPFTAHCGRQRWIRELASWRALAQQRGQHLTAAGPSERRAKLALRRR